MYVTVVFYKDRKKQWRWSVYAMNGRVLADSGEGYRRRGDCLNGAALALGIDSELDEERSRRGPFEIDLARPSMRVDA